MTSHPPPGRTPTQALAALDPEGLALLASVLDVGIEGAYGQDELDKETVRSVEAFYASVRARADFERSRR